MTTHPAETPDGQHGVRTVRSVSSSRKVTVQNGRDAEDRTAFQTMRGTVGDATVPDAQALSQTVREQMQHIEDLASHIELLNGRQRELRMLLLEAHDQLIKRDEELSQARSAPTLQEPHAQIGRIRRHAAIQLQQRDAEIERLRQEANELRASVKQERERLRAFKSTRYWRFRLWVKGLLHRP